MLANSPDHQDHKTVIRFTVAHFDHIVINFLKSGIFFNVFRFVVVFFFAGKNSGQPVWQLENPGNKDKNVPQVKTNSGIQSISSSP